MPGTDDLQPSSILSECGRYRYSLVRHLTAKRTPRSRVLWIMLNPSTADHRIDDPTIRRVVRFSREWGFDELEVVNLFAYRLTDPRYLFSGLREIAGPENPQRIAEAFERAAVIVAAWGSRGGPSLAADYVLELAKLDNRDLVCLGLTADGQPRHPLYAKASLLPIPFKG